MNPRTLLALIIIVFLLGPATGEAGSLRQTITNEHVCGTPQHPHTAEWFAKLAQAAARLPQISSQKTVDQPGKKIQFYSYDFKNETYLQVDATLHQTVENINIWVEDAEWQNGHVNQQVIDSVLYGLLYQTPSGSRDPNKGIIKIIADYFGIAPDSDNSGMVDFLITDIRDNAEANQGFVAGYFNPIDQYNNGDFVNGTRVYGSNERDIMYIDSSPGIYYNETFRYAAVLGTIAHEYQHLVQFNYDKDESTFQNEGFSEISSWLCGYGLREPSRYLANTNLDLADWESGIPASLDHYAKVALWTYYLYDQFSGDMIRALAQDPLNGTSSLDHQLTQMAGLGFDDVLRDFFLAISLNDRSLSDAYGFSLEGLQGLRALPLAEIREFPKSASFSLAGRSMGVFLFENCDSLTADLQRAAGMETVWAKYNYRQPVDISWFTENNFFEPDLGLLYNRGRLITMNLAGTRGSFIYNSTARQKFHTATIEYATVTEPVYNISLAGNSAGNIFTAPYDSSKLHSIRIFNAASTGPVHAELFADMTVNSLVLRDADVYPSVRNAWTELDLEEWAAERDQGEEWHVAVSYPQTGSLGYSSTPAGLGVSYVREEGQRNFEVLSNYELNGSTLNGPWMINLRYLAPIRHKQAISDGEDFYIAVGPSPMQANGESLQITYQVNPPGRMNISIFNVLGQKVIQLLDRKEMFNIGGVSWNGRNLHGEQMASGQYFVRASFDGNVKIRKIILLR